MNRGGFAARSKMFGPPSKWRKIKLAPSGVARSLAPKPSAAPQGRITFHCGWNLVLLKEAQNDKGSSCTFCVFSG
jgi:hypothetical protein